MSARGSDLRHTSRNIAGVCVLAGAVYGAHLLVPYVENLRKSYRETKDAKEMFRAMDTDNSGRVTIDELRRGLQEVRSYRLGSAPTPPAGCCAQPGKY